MLPRTRHLAAFCLAAITSFYLPERGAGWLWWVAILASVGILVWVWRRHLTYMQAACTLFCFVLGAAYAIMRTEYALSQQIPATLYPHSQTFTIRITGVPEHDATERTRFIAQAQMENGQSFRILFNDYQAQTWRVGEIWRINARVRASIGTSNPVGFDREAWALSNAIDGIGSVGKTRELMQPAPSSWYTFNGIRAQIVEQWQRAAQTDYPQGTGLMTALAVGYRNGLSQAAWDAFRPLGLNHLISISGLHITMVGLLAAGIAHHILRWLPRLPRRPRAWTMGIGWLAAFVYTGLAGWEIPALRSLMMLSVFAFGWLMRGQYGVWQTWWAACTLVLLYQPTSVLAVGFWLSFGLVGALLWTLSCRLPAHIKTRQQYYFSILKQAIIGQWAATLIGSIATMFLFGSLPLFSPIVNAIAIPLFSWLIVPLALVASALPSDTLKLWVAACAEQVVQTLIAISQYLPELSVAHAPAPLFALAIIAALMLLLPHGTRLKPLAIIGLTSFALYQPPKPNAPLSVHVWDVGQGLSILLQTHSQNILFDTGTPNDMNLLPNLHALGIRKLDALILSHHDNDHDGGFPRLAKALYIDTLWAGQPAYYPHARHCTGGKNWQIDGIWFEFLTLPANISHDDNEQSCILRVIAGEHALLIMGDVSAKGEAQLIAQHGTQLHSNVLVLGHHGSQSASSGAFLDSVSPHIAIASSGFANHFRHPNPSVQQRLHSRHIALWRTDTQGSLHLSLGNNNTLTLPQAQARYWWQRKPFAQTPTK